MYINAQQTTTAVDTFNSYGNHSSVYASVPSSEVKTSSSSFPAFKPMAKMTDPSLITMESVTKRLKDRYLISQLYYWLNIVIQKTYASKLERGTSVFYIVTN